MRTGKLSWSSKEGRGYFPVKDTPYNQDYFNKYHSYEDTNIGKKLNDFRIILVNKYVDGKVLDVGIGSGTFIKQRGNCVGYDINPAGIEWLNKQNLMLNPYLDDLNVDGITFFDSLEHIEDIDKILNNIKNQVVFVSIPIFKDEKDVLNSKHYRKDEHYHYFTNDGFISYINKLGFVLLEKSNGETKCGRENITTFVFKRKKVIINQFNKIGDIIFSMYYLQRLAKEGYEVVIPVYPWIMELQKHFPEVKFIEKSEIDIDYELRKTVENEDSIIVPLRFSNSIIYGGTSVTSMKSKYDFLNSIFGLGIRWEDWRKVKIIRDIKAERELKEMFKQKDYSFINTSYAMQYNIDIPNKETDIHMSTIDGYSLIDWSHIIEGASTIHTVSTSIIFIIDLLDIDKEVHIYKRPHEITLKNVLYLLDKKWVAHGQQLKPINRSQLLELKEIFDKSEMRFFPCYGTLLGLVRGGDLIDWDPDIDVCIFEEEFRKNGIELLKSFEEKGWILKSIIGEIEEGLVFTFKNKKYKRYVDVHIIYSVGESLCGPFYAAGSRQGDMWELIWYKYPVFNLIKKDFGGVELYIPDIAEKVLAVHYGDSWREEKKVWSRSGAPKNMENTHSRHKLVKGVKESRDRYNQMFTQGVSQ